MQIQTNHSNVLKSRISNIALTPIDAYAFNLRVQLSFKLVCQ